MPVTKYWLADFVGKKKGAIGLKGSFNGVSVTGDDKREALLNLYNEYEHIDWYKFTRQTKFDTVIHSLHVTLDIDMNGDGPDHHQAMTGCWINYKQHGASLEGLLATGQLDHDNGGEPMPINEDIQKKICKWADEHGYGGNPDIEWGGRYD